MKSKLFAVTLVGLLPLVSSAQYCTAQVEAAAAAVDRISYPSRDVKTTASTFTGYSGRHQKSYEVTLSYGQRYAGNYDAGGETKNYQVKVFEFENTDGLPCSIDQVIAK